MLLTTAAFFRRYRRTGVATFLSVLLVGTALPLSIGFLVGMVFEAHGRVMLANDEKTCDRLVDATHPEEEGRCDSGPKMIATDSDSPSSVLAL